VFTGSEKLLGQQIAEPAGRLDRPDPLAITERVSPSDELSDLTSPRLHQPFRDHDLMCIDRDRGVRALVWIDTDHHHRDPPRSVNGLGTAVGTPDLRSRAAVLFRATPQRSTNGRASRVESQPEPGRQAVRERRPLSPTDATSNPATPPSTQSGRAGAFALAGRRE
jgi:hypothetical protein